MAYRIFISSVQREFAKERKAVAEMIRKDMLLGTFFEVFLFEETTAQSRSAQSVYLDEVRNSDIYLGLFGNEYGFEDAEGVSPTEREYDLATENVKAWGLREPEYHPSAVDFRLVLWRQEIKDPRDFTQVGEVGEVGGPGGVESNGARGVESDVETPIKSMVSDGSSRLYPPGAMGVESGGEVARSLRDMILLSVMHQPKSRAEIARSLGKPRIFGNLVRRITTLLDDDLIELTVPDKPNSRLQKYRITRKGRQVAKLLAKSQSHIIPAEDEESSAASGPTKADIGR